jgi:hypothetical protein
MTTSNSEQYGSMICLTIKFSKFWMILDVILVLVEGMFDRRKG